MTAEVLAPNQRDLWRGAESIKLYRSVRLPRLAAWNYNACAYHSEPRADCEYRLCGGPLFDHQTVTVAWLYAVKKGILASEPGTGKTNAMLGVLALAKQLGESLRSVLVVPTTSVGQWQAETERFAPGLITVAVTSGMTRAQRIALYSSPHWELLIIGYHLMSRDINALEHIQPAQVISDDVDPLLNLKNATHKAMVRLVDSADRVIIANATNLQTRLQQLYAASVPIGGEQVWGNIWRFESKYLQKQAVTITVGGHRNEAGQWVREHQEIMQVTGYKNLTDFKNRFSPMMIRHRYEDLEDIRIPDVMTHNVLLELHPRQREKYVELQQGVLNLMKKDQPPQQKQVSAVTAWLHGAQVCAGLPALGEEDGEGASSKLDWTVNAIQSWSGRKIVVYARNIGTIDALQTRLRHADIGYETIWGQDANKEHRALAQRRFWEDPACQVMILSAAGERSLNLQNAQVLILFDLQLNPARVLQLMGRVRRAGSPHERVFVFSLLAVDTQEDRYQAALASRQAIFDAVHDEDHGDLFERLDPDDLARMIVG